MKKLIALLVVAPIAAQSAKMCQMSASANFFASYAYSCDGTNWATSYPDGAAQYKCVDSAGSTNGSLLKATGAEYTTLPASSWKVWGSSTSQATPTAEGIHYCADDSNTYNTGNHPAVSDTNERKFCMCQVLKVNGVKNVGAWRLRESRDSAGCSLYCAYHCGFHITYYPGWRAALLGLQP